LLHFSFQVASYSLEGGGAPILVEGHQLFLSDDCPKSLNSTLKG